jgi:hypothetical protein
MTVLLILAGAALTVVTAIAAGALLLRRANLELTRAEWIALAFLSGAAVLSLSVFCLSIAGLAYWFVFAILAVALIAAGFRYARPRLTPAKPVPWWGAAPLALFGFMYLIHALAPEVSPDGSGYHLGLVRRYLDAHRVFPMPDNMYASLSQGLEMLFLMAYSIGRHSSAALVHLAFLGALVMLMIAFARRADMPAAGYGAAVLVAASPVVGIDAASAYNDVALAAVLFAAFFVLTRFPHARWLAGLIAGFAIAIKYTAAIPVAIAVLYVAFRDRRRTPVAAFAAAILLIAAPWTIRNAAWLHNPVAPLFNRYFPNAAMPVSVEEDYRAAMRTFGGASIDLSWPMEVTVRGAKLQGVVGPVFLLAPLALFALRHPDGRALLAAAVAALIPYPANIGVRFLIPALPFIALAMTFTPLKAIGPALALAQAILCAPWILDRYTTAWRISEVPWRAALRIEPEDQYIRTRLDPGYSIAQLIEAKVPANGVVYTALPIPEAYTSRRLLLDYTGARSARLSEVLALAAGSPVQETTFDKLKDRAVYQWTWRLNGLETPTIRLLPPAGADPHWRVQEVRIDPKPVSVAAEPAAWDARLAIDGNNASFWSPWRADQKASWWEARFAQAVPVAELTVIGAGTAPRLEVSENGRPGLIAANPAESAVSIAPAEAMSFFRAEGVTHLLIHDDEPAAKAMRGRLAEWQLMEEGKSGPGTLYRIALEAHKTASAIDLRVESRNNTR